MANVSFVEVAFFVIVVVIALSYMANQSMEVAMVESRVDKRKYVVRNLPDKQIAADLMGTLNKRMAALIKHMRSKYPGSKDVKRLAHNFNPENVSESGKNDAFTSYSVNKGERLVFCLRSRDEGAELQDDNLLMYVAIHELAHLMTKDVGHTNTFWKNNRLLLTEAINIGVYKKIDFDKDPQKYCGIKIATSIV